MKITINTIKLQNAVAKVIKGAGFNKLLELSNNLGITLEGTNLLLATTDGTNYMYVSLDVPASEDFSIAVNAEMFSKLITKITSEEVALEVTSNALIVRGNGTYTLSLCLDDNGEILSFPNFATKMPEVKESVTVYKEVISAMITSLKPSLSDNAGSIYSNYYVGEFLASTDRAMMSIYDEKMFKDNEFMFSREFVDLLGLATSDVVLELTDEYLIATSDDMCVCAKKPIDTNGFEVAGIKGILALEFNSFCRVSKSGLLALLERLALFVGQYDDSAINLHFTDNALEVSSLSSSGIESIDYKEAKDAVDMAVKINVNRLIAQVKAYSSDTVDIYYGQSKFLKLSDGKLTQIIAYML